MEKHEEVLKQALTNIERTAFLFNNETLAADSKVLDTLIGQLYGVAKDALQALLLYERHWKRISMVPMDFLSQVHLLKQHFAEKYKIPQQEVDTLIQLHTLMHHKDGEIFKFTKNRQINASQVKGILNRTRGLTDRVAKIIQYGSAE